MDGDDDDADSSYKKEEVKQTQLLHQDDPATIDASTGLDDSDDGTLLPCELCDELFPIITFEQHQQHCRISQSLSTSSNTTSSCRTSSPVDHNQSTSNTTSDTCTSPVDQSPLSSSASNTSSTSVDGQSSTMDTHFIGNSGTSFTNSQQTTEPNVDSVCTQLNSLQLLSQRCSNKDQILKSMGGYGQCQYCKVKLLSCSVKHHEKICPRVLNADPGYLLQRIGGYKQCQYCKGKFLSVSVKHHERMCPARTATPPTNRPPPSPPTCATNSDVMQVSAGVFVRCQYCNVKLLSHSVKYHERMCLKRDTTNGSSHPTSNGSFAATSSTSFLVTSTNVAVPPAWGHATPNGKITAETSFHCNGAQSRLGINSTMSPYCNTSSQSFITPSTGPMQGFTAFSTSSAVSTTANYTAPSLVTNTILSPHPAPPSIPSPVCIATPQPPSQLSLPSTPSCTARAVGALTLDIDIVTWNIEKGTHSGSTAGFTDMQRFLLSRHSNNHPEAFFCLQEVKSSSPFLLTSQHLYSDQPGGKSAKEAGVACPRLVANCDISVKQPPPRGSSCRYNDVANCRFYGTIICIKDRSNGATHEFLLVSYHGKYNRMSANNRRIEISAFFKEICCIADMHRMSVIIGGDFNLKVDEWRDLVMKENNGRVEVAVKYEMGPRRKGTDLLDTFAVVRPSPGIHCTTCRLGTPRAIDLNDALQERLVTISDTADMRQTRKVFTIMDHDPVTVTVTLNTTP